MALKALCEMCVSYDYVRPGLVEVGGLADEFAIQMGLLWPGASESTAVDESTIL